MGKTKGLGHLWVVIHNGRTPFWGNIPFGFRKTPVRSSNNYEVVMFCLDYGIRWVRCSKIPFSLLRRKKKKTNKVNNQLLEIKQSREVLRVLQKKRSRRQVTWLFLIRIRSQFRFSLVQSIFANQYDFGIVCIALSKGSPTDSSCH